jgi:hypothetical protein
MTTMIYKCVSVCCYNRCHGNAVKEFGVEYDHIYKCVCFVISAATVMLLMGF